MNAPARGAPRVVGGLRMTRPQCSQTLVCRWCDKPFTCFASRAARRMYCSNDCKIAASRKDRRMHPAGYVLVRAEDGSLVREHRYVMERMLGRSLRSDEHVHHRNGDRTDNRLDNLELLSRNDHLRLHAPDRLPKGWAHHFDSCQSCGTTNRPHHSKGLCYRCYARERRVTRAAVPL